MLQVEYGQQRLTYISDSNSRLKKFLNYHIRENDGILSHLARVDCTSQRVGARTMMRIDPFQPGARWCVGVAITHPTCCGNLIDESLSPIFGKQGAANKPARKAQSPHAAPRSLKIGGL